MPVALSVMVNVLSQVKIGSTSGVDVVPDEVTPDEATPDDVTVADETDEDTVDWLTEDTEAEDEGLDEPVLTTDEEPVDGVDTVVDVFEEVVL